MIKEIAPRKYIVRAYVNYKGHAYMTQRTFSGAYSKAVLLESSLKIGLKERAKNEAKRNALEYSTFGHLLNAFEAVNQYPARMQCYGAKLRRDISALPIENLQMGLMQYFAKLNIEKALGKKKGKDGNWLLSDRLLSAATKNRILSIARMVCRYAVKAAIISSDPLALIKKWDEKKRDRVLNDHELANIRTAIAELEPWLSPAFEFSIRIPIRLGDLRKLSRDNLDLFNGVIRLTAGKTGAVQVAAIPPDMLEYFRTLPKTQVYLFCRDGNPLMNIDKGWYRVLRKAEVVGLRWHDLRHHACSWLANIIKLDTHQLMVTGGWKSRRMVELYHNLQPDTTAQDVGAMFKAHQAAIDKKTLPLQAVGS